MDTGKLITIIIEAGSFIAGFAAVAAGIMMAQVRQKFGTGILASGFKTISIGVFFIAGAIMMDAIQSYIQISLGDMVIVLGLLLIKEAFFVLGTYIIVIGSKKTGDKLESLTQ